MLFSLIFSFFALIITHPGDDNARKPIRAHHVPSQWQALMMSCWDYSIDLSLSATNQLVECCALFFNPSHLPKCKILIIALALL